jgi:tetratricopeptide (TPR) repeat protein
VHDRVRAERDRAAPRIPRDPLSALVCVLLQQRLGEPITPPLLGWPQPGGLRYVPADDGLDQAWDAAAAIAALGEVVDPDRMERRFFMALTGLPLTAVAQQWLLDPARVAASVLGMRVDHAVVDDLERVADVRRRLDDAVSGPDLLSATLGDLRLVLALLRNCAYTEDVGQRLYALAAEFSRIAGWLAFQSQQHAQAQRYFLAALRAAHLSGDRAMGANVLGFMSIQAAFSAAPKDAVLLAESALNGARELTAAVEANTWARLARGAAFAGDAATWQHAQDRVFDLLSRSVPDNEPPWIYFFTEDYAFGMAGESLLALGRSQQAEGHLRNALALMDPQCLKDRAHWLCKLATARIGTGSIEHACATASEAAAVIRKLKSPFSQHTSPSSAEPPSRTPALPPSGSSTPNTAACAYHRRLTERDGTRAPRRAAVRNMWHVHERRTHRAQMPDTPGMKARHTGHERRTHRA